MKSDSSPNDILSKSLKIASCCVRMVAQILQQMHDYW